MDRSGRGLTYIRRFTPKTRLKPAIFEEGENRDPAKLGGENENNAENQPIRFFAGFSRPYPIFEKKLKWRRFRASLPSNV